MSSSCGAALVRRSYMASMMRPMSASNSSSLPSSPSVEFELPSAFPFWLGRAGITWYQPNWGSASAANSGTWFSSSRNEVATGEPAWVSLTRSIRFLMGCSVPLTWGSISAMLFEALEYLSWNCRCCWAASSSGFMSSVFFSAVLRLCTRLRRDGTCTVARCLRAISRNVTRNSSWSVLTATSLSATTLLRPTPSGLPSSPTTWCAMMSSPPSRSVNTNGGIGGLRRRYHVRLLFCFVSMKYVPRLALAGLRSYVSSLSCFGFSSTKLNVVVSGTWMWILTVRVLGASDMGRTSWKPDTRAASGTPTAS
eukprot:PhM_4_TR9820/c1_g4_i1/m.23090